jgi:ubiquinone/menaquinone biosynthesis C-methylase UbiE
VNEGKGDLHSMPQPNADVTKSVQSAYDGLYTDEMTEWRELGGRLKAQNIAEVCRGRTFDTVLECGAGEGSVLQFLGATDLCTSLCAIEISDSGIARIRERDIPKLREVKKFDGYTIPYPDEAFDMVYCSHVIEHVEHPRILLRELKRVGRVQVFEVPLDYSIGVDKKVEYFLSYGHINVYTPSLFRFLLVSEGFEIVSELLTEDDKDSVSYNWYRNMKLERTIRRQLRLNGYFLRKRIGKLIHSRERYEEYGYSAYTCLAQEVGDFRVF